MTRPPTDLELLEFIYERYYAAFTDHSNASPARSTKNYVPIDIRPVADHFRLDPDIIFGRLYYHLDPKYRFVQPDGSKVPDCIILPMPTPVLGVISKCTWLVIKT